MPIAQVDLSSQQLLKAVEQLKDSEFETFVMQVLTLHTQRHQQMQSSQSKYPKTEYIEEQTVNENPLLEQEGLLLIQGVVEHDILENVVQQVREERLNVLLERTIV